MNIARNCNDWNTWKSLKLGTWILLKTNSQNTTKPSKLKGNTLLVDSLCVVVWGPLWHRYVHCIREQYMVLTKISCINTMHLSDALVLLRWTVIPFLLHNVCWFRAHKEEKNFEAACRAQREVDRENMELRIQQVHGSIGYLCMAYYGTVPVYESDDIFVYISIHAMYITVYDCI